MSLSRGVFTSYTRGLAAVSSAALLGLLTAFPATAPVHAQPPASLAASTAWLDRLNLWRTTAGLPPVSENSVYSSGDYSHAVYMVKTGLVTHSEDPANPYYTAAGDTAARSSNIEVSSSTARTDEESIDWWMQAPFHAMGMMDPRLTQAGFGSYRDSTTSPWQSGFALNVIQGNSFTGGTYPVYFPGNGSTEPMSVYSGGEFPDPLQGCPGYAVPTGLPVFIQVGGNVATTAGATHSFTGNGVALEHCVIDSNNTAVGSNLTGRGGVIVVPRLPLVSGVKYAVSLTVNGAPYSWSFTVNPFVTTPPPAGWSSIGGSVSSGPDATSSGATATDVFVRGSDNALWQRSWNGTTWGTWTSLGGTLTADPGAVSQGPGHTDVFVRGTDNAIWHRGWNGTAWSSWDSLGGVATSAPDAASWGVGRLDLVVRGTDNGLWHRGWNGTAWSAWDKIGGTAMSDPSMVASGANRLDVFVRGTDNALWHRSGDGAGTWSAWDSPGGVLSSGPDAASCSPGHLDVFVQGTGNGLWQRGFNGTSWTAWKPLGGIWTSDPSAVCVPGTTTINLFARFADGALWTLSLTGT